MKASLCNTYTQTGDGSFHTEKGTHIEIEDGDSLFILNRCKSELDEWIRKMMPEAGTWERDPDDGLAVWDIDRDVRDEFVEDFALENKDQWEQA